MDEAKKRVGYAAADYIENGMTVGLGTGSTAFFMVEALGKRMKNEHLSIKAVTTSKQTAKQAETLGIPLYNIDDVSHIDLTIDGADEISNDYQGIKGGGGALLYEKIVASYSDKVYWIITENKAVKTLGAFPLPVEVVPYGSGQLMSLFTNKNLQPVLRQKNGVTFVTDSGHYIIDLHVGKIEKPHELADWLIQQVGVVEHGLFLDTVDKVLIAGDDSVQEYDRIKES